MKDTTVVKCGPPDPQGITRVGGTIYNRSSRRRDFTIHVAVTSPAYVQLGVGTAQVLGLGAHQSGDWQALTDVAPEHWTTGSRRKVVSATRS
jgi:hypothetical protein